MLQSAVARTADPAAAMKLESMLIESFGAPAESPLIVRELLKLRQIAGDDPGRLGVYFSFVQTHAAALGILDSAQRELAAAWSDGTGLLQAGLVLFTWKLETAPGQAEAVLPANPGAPRRRRAVAESDAAAAGNREAPGPRRARRATAAAAHPRRLRAAALHRAPPRRRRPARPRPRADEGLGRARLLRRIRRAPGRASLARARPGGASRVNCSARSPRRAACCAATSPFSTTRSFASPPATSVPQRRSSSAPSSIPATANTRG